jgi:iron complex outermembrane recepter protein
VKTRLLAAASVQVLVAAIAANAWAQVVAAEPEAPITAQFPADAAPIEVQVVLQLVVDAAGQVESAVVVSHAPLDAPAAFDGAALDAARRATFRPSMRDGRAIRSRVEYVVVFHPPAPEPAAAAGSTGAAPIAPAESAQAAGASSVAATAAPGAPPAPAGSNAPAGSPPAPPVKATPPLSTNQQDEDYAEVLVHGSGWASPRGLGDLRISRELLDASPRQQTSEMLSAAPGFFVDHEDGEGIGNDVYLRGFDLDHGSGIEMRVGNVPINSPVHVQGQGYADANFIIPEVVRSIRVLEGPYDPRQGDAAIVGSAYFDLGVPERGNLVKVNYGSFNQVRVVGITAPEGADDQTFAAFAVRKTDGFGENRKSESGTANAQYGVDLGTHDHLRLLGTAYAARASLAGVVREDDVNAGRIGAYDSYPFFTHGQGVQSSRVIVGADLDHVMPSGSLFEFAPWFMWTNFRARENYTGNIYSSALDPELAGGLGDLWETSNVESAFGLTARFHAAPLRVGSWLEVATEPGLYVRQGHTDQTKSLLNPDTLVVWDRRLNSGLDTLDTGAYVDIDLRAWKRVRLSGGVRADLLTVSVNDRLGYDIPASEQTGAIPGASRATQGLALSPRATLEYTIISELITVVSYGEGFRSLGANATVATSQGIAGAGPTIQEGATPYSKVRSGEAGLRFQTKDERYSVTGSAFATWVQNELVFEATSGGYSTEGESFRRGVVASAIAKPFDWLLASVAASVASSTFTTLVPGISHYVPNVPPVLFRADLTARGTLTQISGTPLTGRVGIGYTYLAGRHLTDTVTGPSNNILNANTAVRYRNVEVGIEGYNLLNLRYADDASYYVSNWSTQPGTALASGATHLSMAPPLTVLGSVAVYF